LLTPKILRTNCVCAIWSTFTVGNVDENGTLLLNKVYNIALQFRFHVPCKRWVIFGVVVFILIDWLIDWVFIFKDVFNNSNNNNNDISDSNKTLQIIIPIMVICSVLLILVGVWVVYARRHPNTASGKWLIAVRFIHKIFT